MSNTLKYLVAAGAGYALNSYLRKERESKIYKPTPLNEDTLAQKIAATVSGHIVDKVSTIVFDKVSRPTTTYYSNGSPK